MGRLDGAVGDSVVASVVVAYVVAFGAEWASCTDAEKGPFVVASDDVVVAFDVAVSVVVASGAERASCIDVELAFEAAFEAACCSEGSSEAERASCMDEWDTSFGRIDFASLVAVAGTASAVGVGDGSVHASSLFAAAAELASAPWPSRSAFAF